jgi:hypothetical protein
MLTLFFLGVALAICVFHFVTDSSARGKTRLEIATITYIGIGGSKYRPGLFGVVYAQDATGLVGYISVQPTQISGCKVGDKIRSQRSGVALILVPAPCPINMR